MSILDPPLYIGVANVPNMLLFDMMPLDALVPIATATALEMLPKKVLSQILKHFVELMDMPTGLPELADMKQLSETIKLVSQTPFASFGMDTA